MYQETNTELHHGWCQAHTDKTKRGSNWTLEYDVSQEFVGRTVKHSDTLSLLKISITV